MRAIQWMMILVFGFMVIACGGAGSDGSDGFEGSGGSTSNLSTEEQAELVAATMSADQGGVAEDINIATQAATNGPQQQFQSASATHNFSATVNIDFYDINDFLQTGYDPITTDRVDYESRIQGAISNGQGYFTELSIDNRADFTVDEILSRIVWIDGLHTNKSSYTRTIFITGAEVQFELDCELIVSGVTVDLDAADRFPESGTIEGTINGSHRRSGPFGQHTHQFNFYFIATYLGNNTAEVELANGTVFIVQLGNGSVQFTN